MDKKAKYMRRFKTFSPAKKSRHATIAVAYLVQILKSKQAATLLEEIHI